MEKFRTRTERGTWTEQRARVSLNMRWQISSRREIEIEKKKEMPSWHAEKSIGNGESEFEKKNIYVYVCVYLFNIGNILERHRVEKRCIKDAVRLRVCSEVAHGHAFTMERIILTRREGQRHFTLRID